MKFRKYNFDPSKIKIDRSKFKVIASLLNIKFMKYCIIF